MKQGYVTIMSISWSFICLLLVIVGFPTSAQAEGELLPPGIVIGDDKGIHVQSDGAYLVEVKDVMPGKKWQTEVTLLNVEEDEPYELFFQIKPPTVTGPIDFSKAIQMVLIYKDKELYKGPVSGVSEALDLQKEPISLGTYQSGDSYKLIAMFEMDSHYTEKDFVKKSVTENVWEFRAIKKEPTKPKPSPSKPTFPRLPQTGEEWRQMLIALCIGMLLILMVLLIIKKKREQRR